MEILQQVLVAGRTWTKTPTNQANRDRAGLLRDLPTPPSMRIRPVNDYSAVRLSGASSPPLSSKLNCPFDLSQSLDSPRCTPDVIERRQTALWLAPNTYAPWGETPSDLNFRNRVLVNARTSSNKLGRGDEAQNWHTKSNIANMNRSKLSKPLDKVLYAIDPQASCRSIDRSSFRCPTTFSPPLSSVF